MLSRRLNMMKNRGMFMSLYLVVLTLLMCGVVLGFYMNHQKTLTGSLVSPLAVLEVQDELEIFEMRERELIMGSVDEWSGDSLKASFVGGLSSSMKEFIFSDLIWGGKVMDGDFNRDAFLENVLYSVSENSGDLVLKRSKIGKSILLQGDNKVDVNFPVYYEFEFEREYLISRGGGEIKVEVVE
jgi:hypothetical protein